MNRKSAPPIGAHLSINKGVSGSFVKAVNIGADAMQIFTKSPRGTKSKIIDADEISKIERLSEKSKIKFVVIHGSYLLNFSKKLTANSYEFTSLLDDLKSADMLGAKGVIIHMGKKLDMDKKEAISNFIENIKKALELSGGLKSKLLLENTAGQGTEIGFNLDELAEIYKKINNKEKVGICLDTAHLFAAGYDLSSEKQAAEIADNINNLLGIDNVCCVHLNDSKKQIGSRVDRHQDIGMGKIGIKGLKKFVTQLSKLSNNRIAFLLETTEEFNDYAEQIQTFKSWF